MTERRRFNEGERAALFLAADGLCKGCGVDLRTGWHADHEQPYSSGGITDVINGQALCPPCNLQKGSRLLSELRDWQRKATGAFYAKGAQDFLVSATPGAGKTRFALALARRLLDEGTVQRVAVVAPTDALRQQWADNASIVGLALMPVGAPEDYAKPGYQGCVATYAQVARGAGSDLLRRATREPTLAILDEIHHAGDKRAWGDGLRNAVEHAVHRLSLTGTPWRREDSSPIPFVRYERVANEPRPKVCVDFAYEYGEAVADGVCRRIEFHAYDGEAKWRDCGKVETVTLGADLTDEEISAALDTIYHPEHGWMPVLLDQAIEALSDINLEVPDAAGLVIAESIRHAEAYATMLEKRTGSAPVVVTSDDPDAKAAIDRFRTSRDRWIVAVKMVSEGVDIPRLAVGVYASKTKTPLFFRQVVGRFVRVRPGEEFNARLLIPAVSVLMQHAREIEVELRHQLDLEKARDTDVQEGEVGDRQAPFDLREPISASEAVFDRAILGGEETTPEDLAAAQLECRRLGIPAQYALNILPLMRQRGDSAFGETVAKEPPPRHRREKMLRGEVESLARKLASRSGTEPRNVNTALIRKFGPRSRATVEQLEEMVAFLAARLGEL